MLTLGMHTLQLLSLILYFAATVFVPALKVPSKAVVHLVAHTHSDLGWLKTVDQYTYGLNNSIQFADVTTIINSVVEGLLANPERKFTYVEIGFFSWWWSRQSVSMREKVRGLVANGQLQFANGGWCMHDEATTHYIDMIDQTTLGHRWLLRELNVVPLVGWQADAFGHSATQASLLTSRAGFNGTFFARIDYREYEDRVKRGGRQFWWDASPSLPDLKTFAEANLHATYCSAAGYKWDLADQLESARTFTQADDIIDDNASERYNVPVVLKHFKDEVARSLQATRGANVMWTMGCDFTYMVSEFWFGKMDKLIKIANDDGEFTVRYSTPYEYMMAKLDEAVNAKTKYETSTGDFFPYASAAHEFWTGFYSSRPTLKRLIRMLSSYWVASRQLQFLAGVPSGDLPLLSDALAIAQHHDAVTGTARQHVTFDYVKRLVAGYNDDFSVRLRTALTGRLFNLSNVSHCLLSNVSACNATATGLAKKGSKLTVMVWNPSVHPNVNTFLQIPVPRRDIRVEGNGVKSFSVYGSPTQVSDYSNVNANWQPYTIGIILSLGKTSSLTLSTPGKYDIPRKESHFGYSLKSVVSRDRRGGFTLTSDHLKVRFGVNGRLKSIEVLSVGQEVLVEHDWCYFKSSRGEDPSGISGGAYIMRPVSDNVCEPISTDKVESIIIDETIGIVEQRFGNDLVQRVILHGDTVDLEFTSLGIPVKDGFGRELVARFSTSVNNSGIFYTDSNGREMQRREVDKRRNYPFVQTESVAGNYYPVSSLIFINDTETQFNVFTDAAMGGTSINNGEVLLTTHRRLLLDDQKGVSEPLNETEFITAYEGDPSMNEKGRGKHYGNPLRVRGTLTISVGRSGPSAMRRVREQLDEKYFSPIAVYSTGSTPNLNCSLELTQISPSVQIITTQLLNKTTLLLRIAHRYAVGEDDERSKSVEMELRSLIPNELDYNVESIDEVSLTTNTLLRTGLDTVVLKPMDVRTFLFHMREHKWRGMSVSCMGV
ncbi:lysosomal alpha-mannosidase precursor, putative [Trypanosoma brucei gambiense DAL972]|uniref:Alpha-mannosidase n=1 Tax=Trypanosoma brucei gambiense (strain MHOM/CI/86/DAL972) TaxID=679716 RepID=D0A1U2_TRYB9|nr:lysosomal alpha-mannosidase precursor, putative [Trypanosoma brucei gambiense DAL972]CBH15235.1 lysosomal alpha-mannosidase precursor, putative [Trypanosoma brucei gambiense DAL972]|eukprot:XP_011777500.1 lysosomal alpha-mannosidase precursor, putative [Trypanosoma brucei gambiense DAL972]